MNMITLADLHIHSNYSDGSDNLTELVKSILDAKLDIFALTDHDTIEGCNELKSLLPENICFIPSVELTSKTENINCHILGINCDSKNKTLTNLIKKGKELRQLKVKKRIEYLKEVWNIELTEQEKTWLKTIRSITKTHLGIILVQRGLAPNNLEAMDKYLNGCKIPNSKFDGYESVNTILKSGGIPIWAHPLGGEGERHITPEEFKKEFDIMKQSGILGLECYYSRYSKDEINFLVEFAKENKLLISGGSDYHGKNKQNINIGKLNTENIPINAEKLTVIKEVNYC